MMASHKVFSPETTRLVTNTTAKKGQKPFRECLLGISSKSTGGKKPHMAELKVKPGK
jgi:hypothetical protein